VRNSRTVVLAIALVLAACSRSNATSNGAATDDGIAAIALPEDQYREMLKRAALGTQSGPMYLGILGLDEGCEALDTAVNQVVGKNLPQWRANLIAAYRDNVPSDELAEAVQKSPRSARSMLQQHLPAIGSSMKSASEELLKSSAAEVLETLSVSAAKIDQASIDMADRQRELAQMKASGRICGVGRWQQQ
jgi:hypothetical protein